MGDAIFYALAILPGLIVLGMLAATMRQREGMGWPLGCATIGCLLAAASPWISIWFVWNVLGDHTANIGAGLLVFAQPLLVPLGAGLGALIGAAIGAAIYSPGDAEDRGDLPPIA